MNEQNKPQIVCPNCGLLSPINTRICECGYCFKKSRVPYITSFGLIGIALILSLSFLFDAINGQIKEHQLESISANNAPESAIVDTQTPQLEAPSPAPESKPPRYESLMPTAPLPVSYSNGELVIEPLNEAVCPLSVVTNSDCAYYVVLQPISSPRPGDNSWGKRWAVLEDSPERYSKTSFLIKPGATVDIDVPIGVYRIYYATGTTWYGAEHFFGENTNFYECEGTFDFYDDGTELQGWTLELFAQVNGNLDTEVIDAENFPG